MQEWLTGGKPIAHRGLHALPKLPENSLAAFAAAIKAEYPIELDVRLLADGEVIVFHDADLERLTGVEGLIAEQTVETLRELRLMGTREPIPLLSETLRLVAGQVPLLIEIKNEPATVGPLEAAILQTLADYTGAFAVQSFCKETVAYLAAYAPHILRGQLSSGNDDWYDENTPLPDFLGYRGDMLPTTLSTALRANGLPLLVWTIQTTEQQSRVAEFADNYIFEFIRP